MTESSRKVSIQLVSPASGDYADFKDCILDNCCFHSISFPSEWGLLRIQKWEEIGEDGFHSISFPSEWGQESRTLLEVAKSIVSIQLVSPASGDLVVSNLLDIILSRFHSISFPSEWGL